MRTSTAAVGRAAPQLVAHVPVALTEDLESVFAAGNQMLDFYAQIPFYANMFTNAGFPSTPNKAMSDNLVESFVVSGTEASVAARFTELLATGLDELMVSLVPTSDEGDDEQARLAHLIGRL